GPALRTSAGDLASTAAPVLRAATNNSVATLRLRGGKLGVTGRLSSSIQVAGSAGPKVPTRTHMVKSKYRASLTSWAALRGLRVQCIQGSLPVARSEHHPKGEFQNANLAYAQS